MHFRTNNPPFDGWSLLMGSHTTRSTARWRSCNNELNRIIQSYFPIVKEKTKQFKKKNNTPKTPLRLHLVASGRLEKILDDDLQKWKYLDTQRFGCTQQDWGIEAENSPIRTKDPTCAGRGPFLINTLFTLGISIASESSISLKCDKRWNIWPVHQSIGWVKKGMCQPIMHSGFGWAEHYRMKSICARPRQRGRKLRLAFVACETRFNGEWMKPCRFRSVLLGLHCRSTVHY